MKLYICLSLFWLPLTLGRQVDAGEDSIRTYYAGDVVVTATRSSIQAKDSPSPVQVLTAQDIQRTNGNSIADVLRSSTSVFLKDRGPDASLKTISLRGAASEHILVLVDGVRMNNFQNGSVDFSLLPMQNIDRIEVVRGGSSALYGADALGGVINIITSRPTETMQIHAEASGGSFAYRRYVLEMRGRISGLGLVAGFMNDHAVGDYPFTYHKDDGVDVALTRTGADFNRTQFYLNSDYNLDTRSAITFSIQRVKMDQGVPGSLTFPSAGRQTDDAVIAIATVHDNHLHDCNLDLRLGYNYGFETYTLQMFPLTYHYRTPLVTMNPQMQWIMNTWDRLIVGGEFVEGTLEGITSEGSVKRIQRSVYVSNEMFFQRESPLWDRLSLYQAIRYDDLSEGVSSFSPKLGFNVRLFRDWETRIRASYGKNFRMPTFNDLYDPFLGNPLLKPEYSDCFDVGIEAALDRMGMHFVQLTYFDIDTRDRILPNAFYFPVNVHEAQSKGIEGRYDIRLLSNTLNAFADVTLNNAVRRNGNGQADSTEGKQLLNIPKTVGSFGLFYQAFGMRLNVIHTITSKRYIAEDESKSLPGYSLTSINLSLSIPVKIIRLSLRAEASNIFDTEYEIVQGYPMPGRTYRVTAAIGY